MQCVREVCETAPGPSSHPSPPRPGAAWACRHGQSAVHGPGKLMAGLSDSCPCLCFAGEPGFMHSNSLDLSGKAISWGQLRAGWREGICWRVSVGTLLPGPAVPLCGRGTFGRSFSSSDKAAIFAMGTCTPALRQNTVRTVSVGQRSREGPSRTSNIRSPLSVLNSHITERRFSRNPHAGLLQLRLLGPTLRTSNLIGLVGSEDAHL